MKRMLVLLAILGAAFAVAAPMALAGGGTTVATCNAGNNYLLSGSSSNVDIPAGTFCYLTGEFKGNVSVEGYASPEGATFDKNVNVTGGTIFALNHGAHILGNLNISGSHGVAGVIGANGLVADYEDITIEGNLNYIGNFVPLYVATPPFGDTGTNFKVEVKGNFTYSGNTVPWDAGQPLTVDGQSSIS